MDWLNTVCDKVGEFSLTYGGYIIALCAGFLIGMGLWFKRRPEDFIHTDAEDEQPEAADER